MAALAPSMALPRQPASAHERSREKNGRQGRKNEAQGGGLGFRVYGWVHEALEREPLGAPIIRFRAMRNSGHTFPVKFYKSVHKSYV